jgi:hypothetical protein
VFVVFQIKKGQLLIDLENLETAKKLIEWCDNSSYFLIEDRHVLLEYWKNQTLNSETDWNFALNKTPPSPLLLVFVKNHIYPVTLDI